MMETTASSGRDIRDPRTFRRNAVFGTGLLSLAAAFCFALTAGAADIGANELWAALVRPEHTDVYRILYHIRVPRVIVGALTGINLALAGCVLQGVLKNPLADPGVIGVSAGAGVAAMAVMILLPQYAALVPAAAFAGAMLAIAAVFFLSWERGIQPLRLILAGVAVSAFFGGAMSALMVFYADQVQGTVNWLAGGFQGRSWSHVGMILPYSAAGMAGAFALGRRLNALQLGDETAKSLGMRVEAVRFCLLAFSALLAASAVSVAGMLGFVGLIVPHMIRLLIGSDFTFLLPCAALYGAVLVVGADAAARSAFSPLDVPVGIFMAFLGAPFFLYLLKKGMKGR